MDNYEFISQNLSEIDSQIKQACQTTGRDCENVKLICVSKTKPVEMLKAAYNAGYREFGENKVQEITLKAPEMPDDTIFHMIGHLQKNKVKKAVQYAEIIHSVDSYELAEVINNEAGKINKVQKILIEINIASEESKYGVKTESVAGLIKKLSEFENIKICGLMCVAPFTEEAESNRQYFRTMQNLLIDINSLNINNVNMDILSMGMSGDFKVAIEEGATHVRVGTAIFGERDYTKK